MNEQFDNTQFKVSQLELQLKLEKAKVQHMVNLVEKFKEAPKTYNKFKLFDYVESIK